jgi:hypothetical protein
MMKYLIPVVALSAILVGSVALAQPMINIEDLPPVAAVQASYHSSALPWRRGVEEEERKLEKGIEGVGQEQAATKSDVAAIRGILEAQQAAQAAANVAKPAAPPTVIEKVEAKQAEVKEKADALLESPTARHAAIFALIIAVCMVGHAVYTKCHADRAKIDDDLEKKNPKLRQLFDKIDDFNTSIAAKLDGHKADVNAKLNGLQAQVTQTALAVPPPTAPVAQTPTPVVVNVPAAPAATPTAVAPATPVKTA